jgi:hypothetical protein
MMRRPEFLMMPTPRRPAPPRAAPKIRVERPLLYYWDVLGMELGSNHPCLNVLATNHAYLQLRAEPNCEGRLKAKGLKIAMHASCQKRCENMRENLQPSLV